MNACINVALDCGNREFIEPATSLEGQRLRNRAAPRTSLLAPLPAKTTAERQPVRRLAAKPQAALGGAMVQDPELAALIARAEGLRLQMEQVLLPYENGMRQASEQEPPALATVAEEDGPAEQGSGASTNSQGGRGIEEPVGCLVRDNLTSSSTDDMDNDELDMEILSLDRLRPPSMQARCC